MAAEKAIQFLHVSTRSLCFDYLPRSNHPPQDTWQKKLSSHTELSVELSGKFRFQFALRLVSYVALWMAYLVFMDSHAPRGIDWLPWHSQRIYNAVQYLEVNGYFSAYGFSIWSECQNCSFTASEWAERIYLSATALKLAPYIFLNHFGGMDALKIYGPLIDKVVIFISAAAAAELVIRCVRSYSSTAPYIIGIACFALFATAPWTYKMLLSSWLEIYFLMFFLLGLLSFDHGRNRTACAMFLLAGACHFHWAFAVAAFYVLLFLVSLGSKDDQGFQLYQPSYGRTGLGKFAIIAALMIPGVVELFLRLLAQQAFQISAGASILARIGVAGNDIHNGGLLGALQFLGGNRITVCLADYGSGIIPRNLTDGITRYNCILSVAGMGALSIAAIVGAVILLRQSAPAKWIVFPLVYALLLFITLLQQSLSVHLQGYSYIFSFLFASGMVGLMVYFSQFIRSSVIGIAVSIPCVIGVILLSVRVSMLTGANG